MAQAVSGSHLTIEARFQACVSTSGTCSGQSNTGQVFIRVLWLYPDNIIPPRLSILTYHLGHEQYARW